MHVSHAHGFKLEPNTYCIKLLQLNIEVGEQVIIINTSLSDIIYCASSYDTYEGVAENDHDIRAEPEIFAVVFEITHAKDFNDAVFYDHIFINGQQLESSTSNFHHNYDFFLH